MSRLRRIAAGLVASSGVLLVPAASAAQEGAPPYELDYRAEPGCPSQAEFERWVRSQIPQTEQPPVGRTRARVSVRDTPGRAVGRFDLERGDGTRSSRELEAVSCQEAAGALAFVLALALSGHDLAADGTLPPSSAAPAPPPPAPLAQSSKPPPALEAALRRPKRWHVGLGAQLGARSGVGSSWTAVESGFLAFRREGGRPWALALRLALLRGLPTQRALSSGEVSFEWLAGRAEACPWRADFGRFGVMPCLAAHVGRIVVDGTPAPLPGARRGQAAKPWAEVGGALRLELPVVGALAVEGQAEALAPLTRYQFVFDRPDTPVYRVPGLAVSFSLGLAAHFP